MGQCGLNADGTGGACEPCAGTDRPISVVDLRCNCAPAPCQRCAQPPRNQNDQNDQNDQANRGDVYGICTRDGRGGSHKSRWGHKTTIARQARRIRPHRRFPNASQADFPGKQSGAWCARRFELPTLGIEIIYEVNDINRLAAPCCSHVALPALVVLMATRVLVDGRPGASMAVAVFGSAPAPWFAATRVVARACAPERQFAVAE